MLVVEVLVVVDLSMKEGLDGEVLLVEEELVAICQTLVFNCCRRERGWKTRYGCSSCRTRNKMG